MRPHPEGGWYVESFRAPAPSHFDRAQSGARSPLSAIYFLLQQGERSHWHTVDACEVWLWHAGAPIRLRLSNDGVETETRLLGADWEQGEQPHVAVSEGVWQSAESTGAWTLVSCVVAPGFSFEGFRIAPPGWAPGQST